MGDRKKKNLLLYEKTPMTAFQVIFFTSFIVFLYSLFISFLFQNGTEKSEKEIQMIKDKKKLLMQILQLEGMNRRAIKTKNEHQDYLPQNLALKLIEILEKNDTICTFRCFNSKGHPVSSVEII